MKRIKTVCRRVAGIAAILFVMIAAACSSDSSSAVSDEITEAEHSLSAGDPATAKEISDALMKGDTHARLTVGDLCRLSMVYMQLADISDEGDNIGYATQCWREAYKMQPDSAKAYYNRVPAELQKNVILLAALVRTMDHPGAIRLDEEDVDDEQLYYPDFENPADSIAALNNP